jgi:hypothetical protein
MKRPNGAYVDPRRPDRIVAYHLPRIDPEDMDPDYYGFLGMVLGMIAAVLRVHLLFATYSRSTNGPHGQVCFAASLA